MSQKTASQTTIRPRVSGGVPWWIAGALVVIGGAILYSLVTQALPEDPKKLFNLAMAGVTDRNKEQIDENLAKLQVFPEYAPHCRMLEGILELSTGRPLKAIKKLEEAIENEEIRPTALQNLGIAYAQADQRWKALDIFEKLLAEDPNADAARHSAAVIYAQIIAWDKALEHLNILAERKYELNNILPVRSNIREELGLYNEAAEDMVEAINAMPTDPGNGSKATKLMYLFVKTDQAKRGIEFAEYVDEPGVRAMMEIDEMLKNNQLAEAQSRAMEMRRENSFDLTANKTLARVMLAFQSKEKAIEGLKILKISLVGQRDIELYKSIAELSRLAEDNEFADLVQQNVDQLESLNAEFRKQLTAMTPTLDNAESRVELFHLAVQTGRRELAFKLLDGLKNFYPDRYREWYELDSYLYWTPPQIVNTLTPAELEAAAATLASEERPPTPPIGKAPGGQAQQPIVVPLKSEEAPQ